MQESSLLLSLKYDRLNTFALTDTSDAAKVEAANLTGNSSSISYDTASETLDLQIATSNKSPLIRNVVVTAFPKLLLAAFSSLNASQFEAYGGAEAYAEDTADYLNLPKPSVSVSSSAMPAPGPGLSGR